MVSPTLWAKGLSHNTPRDFYAKLQSYQISTMMQTHLCRSMVSVPKYFVLHENKFLYPELSTTIQPSLSMVFIHCHHCACAILKYYPRFEAVGIVHHPDSAWVFVEGPHTIKRCMWVYLSHSM